MDMDAPSKDTDRYFDSIEEGETYTVEAARTITEADVVNFAGISGDFHPLHVSTDRAADSERGVVQHRPAVVRVTVDDRCVAEVRDPVEVGDSGHGVDGERERQRDRRRGRGEEQRQGDERADEVAHDRERPRRPTERLPFRLAVTDRDPSEEAERASERERGRAHPTTPAGDSGHPAASSHPPDSSHPTASSHPAVPAAATPPATPTSRTARSASATLGDSAVALSA